MELGAPLSSIFLKGRYINVRYEWMNDNDNDNNNNSDYCEYENDDGDHVHDDCW